MKGSLLRKRRAQPSPPGQQEQPSLRTALSLPDLTTPLLDPSSWEQLPSEALVSPSITGMAATSPRNAPTTPGGSSTTPRGRSPSLVRQSSPVSFHRPFTPWPVVVNPNVPAVPAPDTGLGSTDFRTSRVAWSRESVYTTTSQAGGRTWRKRPKSKAVSRLNVVVVGSKGVGKTSFVELLLDSLEDSKEAQSGVATTAAPPWIRTALLSPLAQEEDEDPSKLQVGSEGDGSVAGYTPSSPTSPGPPAAELPVKEAELDKAVGAVHATATTPTPTPTSRLSARSITVVHDSYERTLLRLIDTPGLATGSDVLEMRERERGVSGLVRMIEERFGEVMREESRVVRKATRGEDDLVHLVIYLVDARAVLHPRTDTPVADWSASGLFDEAENGQEPDAKSASIGRPSLATTDIEVIRRLSKRANVLPIIGHADTLTLAEMETVRAAVQLDLSLLPSGGFGLFAAVSDEDDASSSTLSPSRAASKKSSAGTDVDMCDRPPTPASTIHSGDESVEDGPELPFAVFAPEKGGARFGRRFGWGTASVMDPDQSDFIALRDAILGTHVKALRMTTREVLYEQYRTEKLLEKQQKAKTRV